MRLETIELPLNKKNVLYMLLEQCISHVNNLCLLTKIVVYLVHEIAFKVSKLDLLESTGEI